MIQTKIFELNNFTLLKKDWKRIEQGADMTAFQSYSWYTLINEQYKKKAYIIPGQAVYIAAYDDNEIKMIAPLFIIKLPSVAEKFNITNGAHILGKWGYTDYLNFIYDDFSEDCFEKIVSVIRNTFYVSSLNLHQLLPDTSIRKYIDTKYPSALLFEGECAKINVKDNFDTYYNTLSKSTRQNLRTAKNRADKDNVDIHYELHKQITYQDAKEFYEIYRTRQKIKKTVSDANKNGFVKSVISKYTEYKQGRFNLLINAMTSLENGFILGCYSGEEKIGMCMGIEDAAGVRIPVVCFKESFAKYSPCMLCIFQYIKDSYEKNFIKTFDLLKGSEQYKTRLGGEIFSIGYYKISL